MQTETLPEVEQDNSVDFDLVILGSWDEDHCESWHTNPGNERCTHQVVGFIQGCDGVTVRSCQAHLTHKLRGMAGGYACAYCKKPAAECWTITYL